MTLPWKASFCLTYVCNLRCGFCRIWERRPKGELSAEEWEKILAKSPRLKWIDFTGGEPTARPDLHEILDSALRHHKPWLVHFPTNGSFPDRLKPLAGFARRGRIAVTVSIDGPRALHDRMRGVDGSFAKAVEALRILRAMPGIRSVAGMTLSAENEDAVGETVRELEREIPGFDRRDLHVNLAQVSEHYYGNAPDHFREAARVPDHPLDFRSPSALAYSLVERRYRKLLPRFLSARRSPLPCCGLEASVFVSPMGLVHPCITDPRVVGNLRERDYDLRAVLEDDKARRVRGEIAAGRCPHCWTPCEAFPTIIESWGARKLMGVR